MKTLFSIVVLLCIFTSCSKVILEPSQLKGGKFDYTIVNKTGYEVHIDSFLVVEKYFTTGFFWKGVKIKTYLKDTVKIAPLQRYKGCALYQLKNPDSYEVQVKDVRWHW
jgi:hypothetical protein